MMNNIISYINFFVFVLCLISIIEKCIKKDKKHNITIIVNGEKVVTYSSEKENDNFIINTTKGQSLFLSTETESGDISILTIDNEVKNVNTTNNSNTDK